MATRIIDVFLRVCSLTREKFIGTVPFFPPFPRTARHDFLPPDVRDVTSKKNVTVQTRSMHL